MAGAGRSVASFVETRLAALTPEIEKAAIFNSCRWDGYQGAVSSRFLSSGSLCISHALEGLLSFVYLQWKTSSVTLGNSFCLDWIPRGQLRVYSLKAWVWVASFQWLNSETLPLVSLRFYRFLKVNVNLNILQEVWLKTSNNDLPWLTYWHPQVPRF